MQSRITYEQNNTLDLENKQIAEWTFADIQRFIFFCDFSILQFPCVFEDSFEGNALPVVQAIY